ncbi:MAG: polyphosphate kinase 1 [Spirochaetaceae bacterium]|nr:polyphosphate kinase 1 [Spirochaetaceae bacterium]MBQ8352998.1 polyphosphate kinase 1 [Spirochaetaceae bacterium]
MDFFNRELSWVEFNARVLNQACDKTLPLLERLKFMTITSSNFDEFFMVRVAGLKAKALSMPDWKDSSGLTAKEQLSKISKRVHELTDIQTEVLNREIIPSLAEKGIVYVSSKDFDSNQEHFSEILFNEEIFPLLTPLRADTNQTFSLITNLKLHGAYLLKPIVENPNIPTEFLTNAEESMVIVQIPKTVRRVIWLPSKNDQRYFTLVDDILEKFVTKLFPGYKVTDSLIFKATCDADFSVEEDKGDFIQAMENVLVKRDFAKPVRLVCNSSSPKIQEMLTEKLQLNPEDVYTVDGIVDISTLIDLREIEGFSELKFSSWKKSLIKGFVPGQPFWDKIKQGDILLHVPYQSYEPVLQFINDAADDPDVLAIKMTLYRTSNHSAITAALERAARNGKQVTVFVELKARFDEKQNISWADRLERAGAIVVYGIVNLKVHGKLMLVVRREQTGVKRYVHFSTGNYNEKTANLYSDISVFTGNYEIATDASLFFNMISGYSAIQTMTRMFMAPINIKTKLLSMIEREIQSASPEKPGLIMAKMNSLADEDCIKALYKASCNNVKVLLNVRGICMLIPQKEGLSENIKVISIIDRFLEHSRVFYFQNGGNEELYLSSADWMPRNLERRVEIMLPILQENIFQDIKENLQIYFKDTESSYELQSDGGWKKRGGKKNLRAQEELYKKYKKQSSLDEKNAVQEFSVRRFK